MEIPFSIKTKFGNYNDVLFFLDDAVPPEEEIKALKEARVRAWVQRLLRPASISPELMLRASQKEPPPPTGSD